MKSRSHIKPGGHIELKTNLKLRGHGVKGGYMNSEGSNKREGLV